MSSWDGARFQYGERTNSIASSLRQKDHERAEIETLTAEYLLRKQITQVPYGVRTDKIEFEKSDFRI